MHWPFINIRSYFYFRFVYFIQWLKIHGHVEHTRERVRLPWNVLAPRDDVAVGLPDLISFDQAARDVPATVSLTREAVVTREEELLAIELWRVHRRALPVHGSPRDVADLFVTARDHPQDGHVVGVLVRVRLRCSGLRFVTRDHQRFSELGLARLSYDIIICSISDRWSWYVWPTTYMWQII